MNASVVDQQSRLWSAIVWVLRISVALACLGTWDWFVRWEETPFLQWLLDPTDIGGLGWNESTALVAQRIVGWFVLAAGVSVLVRPTAAVLAPLTLLHLLVAVAMWRTDDGFSLESSWLSPSVSALFPFATQMARIAAPLGLLLLDPWRCERPLSERRVAVTIGVLRWVIAITFVAHGLEAWLHYPEFVDYWIGTTRKLFGTRMSESTADTLLSFIGCLDFLAAAACVTTRWRAVGWWMVFWGAATAFSRITSYGLNVGWHATAIRAPHVGVPLAVVLYWHLVGWNGEKSAGESAAMLDDEVSPDD
jgi:hypothetical protein